MSVIRNKGGEEISTPEKGVTGQLYDLLSSVRLAIILLCLIALGSIIGTLIKQNGTVDEYLSLYSESTYGIIRFLSLDDVFHSLWFFTLIILFVMNLSACTVERFRKLARTGGEYRVPSEKALSGMTFNCKTMKSREEVQADLSAKGYREVHKDEEGTVLEKGHFSRYGVFIVHGSIIIILLGNLIGFMWGYKGSLVLSKGETKDRIILRSAKPMEYPLGFSIKCKDFKVSFYPNGAPKEYVSTVEVIDNGKSVLETRIRVNEPLSYKGIRMYQATYGRDVSFRFNVGGEEMTLKERDTVSRGGLSFMVMRYEASVHDFGPGVQVAYLENGQPQTTWFLKDVPKHRERVLGGVTVSLENISEGFYTGLEVARDPGVWVVWTGFALILFGMFVTFWMSHRRIYLRSTSNGTLVAGTAFRSREGFREEFDRLKGRLDGSQS